MLHPVVEFFTKIGGLCSVIGAFVGFFASHDWECDTNGLGLELCSNRFVEGVASGTTALVDAGISMIGAVVGAVVGLIVMHFWPSTESSLGPDESLP